MPRAFAFVMVVVGMLTGAWLRDEWGTGCGAALRSLAADGTLSDLGQPDFSDCRTVVKEFYENRGYAPAWIADGAPTEQAVSVFHTLESAEAKGLRRADYDAGLWASRVAALRDNRGRVSEHDLARFDLALTISLTRYLVHVSLGKANPEIFLSAPAIQERKRALRNLLDQLPHATGINDLLNSVEPRFPGYQRTLTALRLYTDIAQTEDGGSLPSPQKPVASGGSYAEVPQLVQRLIRFGDLPPKAASECAGNLYQGPLVDAVKRFQLRHGLEPSGLLSASTIEELNVSAWKRVAQLQLTLERYRWVPYKPGRRQILVNIPEFRLRTLDEDYLPELELKVVVGRAYRHQTPVFWSEMRQIIFRPYWNIPQRIQQAEVIPKLRRTPAYLARNDYEVVNRSGTVITRTTITDEVLSQLEAGTLRMRQTPGPRNALGLVKFVFPNNHNVYLHDTPATELFSRPRRDFSHGCIRVENPTALAAWALTQKPGWTSDRVREAMEGEKTVHVELDVDIPVLIVYATAIVLPNGEVRFFHDIYGHDAALERRLSAVATH